MYRTQTLITLFLTHLSWLGCSEQLAACNLEEGGKVSHWDRSRLAREEGDSPSSEENSLAAERLAHHPTPDASFSMACYATHNSHHLNDSIGKMHFFPEVSYSNANTLPGGVVHEYINALT